MSINQPVPTLYGKSPLMMAAMYGHKSVITALLDAGADPNLGSDEEFEKGTTALMYVASSFFASNRAEVIKFLVDRGADVNAQNEQGKTALMMAGEHRCGQFERHRKDRTDKDYEAIVALLSQQRI